MIVKLKPNFNQELSAILKRNEKKTASTGTTGLNTYPGKL